jgi:hypothetical protein
MALAVVVGAGPVPAEPNSGPQPARIANLVRQLGHDKYAEREAAAKELSEMGVPALDALQLAEASSRDPEVQQRAGQAIREIAADWQGTWECVAHHAVGRFVTRDRPYTSRWSFDGLAMTGRTQGDDTVTQRVQLEIVEAGDHSYKVNYVITEGNGRGETLLGIAAFRDGQVRFSFRTAGSGIGRPDGFVTKAGDKAMVYVFQRSK